MCQVLLYVHNADKPEVLQLPQVRQDAVLAVLAPHVGAFVRGQLANASVEWLLPIWPLELPPPGEGAWSGPGQFSGPWVMWMLSSMNHSP